MAATSIICALLLLRGATAAVSDRRADMDTDAGANPIRKIVTLLQDMQKEIEAEGAKEKELYDKFMCFCSGGEGELTKTVADSKQTEETLTSKLEEEKAEKAGLEGDLVKHEADRVAAKGDLDKATALRNKENAEYEEDLGDQTSSFEAISGAIPALEKGMSGASLLQATGVAKTKLQHIVDASQSVSADEKRSVMAFLEGSQSEDYAPASGQIVGILKNMKDEMEKTIESIKTSETTAVAGYGDLKAAKEQEIEVASESIEAKTKRVGALAVSVVQSADGIEDAEAEGAKAAKFLSTLSTQCAEKEKDYAERTKMRAEEVSAISEAISILNDDDALDVFKKAVPSALLQRSSEHAARKFGFLQATAAAPADRLAKAEAMLTAVTKSSHSRQFALLAYAMKTRIRAAAKAKAFGLQGGAVDFSQITKMIDEMLAVLEAEGAGDEKHKTWCADEFDSSEAEDKSVTTKISMISSEMSETADEVASLADDISALQAGIAALDKDVAEATEQRKEEHAEYLETVSLTEAAVELMGKAKNRLQKFYNPDLYKAPPKRENTMEEKIIDAGSYSFAQVRSASYQMPEAPEMPSGPYESKSGKSGGVMALMDMLVKELEGSLKEAEYEEKTGQKEYTELMSDSEATRAQDSKSITDKSAAKATLEGKLTDLKENKQTTTEQLQNIQAYVQELHASCDFILENFKLRAEARTSEIEGLKNAKAVLAGASYSF